MIQNFDFYRQSEKPEFILCNPDDTVLCSLTVFDTQCTLRYNDTSELSFQVQEGCTDGYDLLAVNREVLVDGLGYFIIDTVSEDSTDGEHHGTKTVNAKSAQYELSFKLVDYVNGVLPFYDSTHTSDTLSFMEHMLTLMPGWSFVCDSALESKYRSIEITKRTVLDSLYSVASEAYQCIFTFDFLTRTVRADAISNLTKDGVPVQQTDIYLSFDNVIDGIDLRESSDDIKTKLYVYGQDLDIRQVNPLGTAYLLNLDYYANDSWMDADMISAYNSWKVLVASKEAMYANLLTSLREHRVKLTTLQAKLVTEQGVRAEYDNIVSVKIEGGYTNDDSYQEAVAKVKEQDIVISGIQADIDTEQATINSLLSDLSEINDVCLPENAISSAVYKKLQRFFREGEYSNTNYVVTDLMSAEDIQDEALELYDEGKQVLAKVSQPSFTLSVDAKAFIHMQEFLSFTNQLELGCMVTVEKDEDTFYTPILLEMEFSWDDKEDFSLSFGNRFRLDDAGSTYEELLGTAANTSSSISANWESIVDFKRNYKNDVADLLNNAFNVALKSIISSADQEIVWDASGLTCRKLNPETHVYDDEQFKIINNMIAFTDDGWNTLKTIIGKIALDPEQPENTKYGIAAEVLVGQLLAGENLVIANDSGTFRVDGDGVYFGVKKTDEDGNEIIVDLKDFFSGELDKLTGDIGDLSGKVDENGNVLENLANQISGVTDGKISSYYQDTAPYGEIPEDVAASADSEEYREAAQHEGDLWYDTTTKLSYRYTKYGDEENGYYFLWSEFAGVPEDVYDKIDGKRTIYTAPPIYGFDEGDLWIYDPNTMQIGDTVYMTPNGAEAKDDLLIATGSNASGYDAALWKKYSTNISKENSSTGFSFKLDNDGMTLKNGDITMEKTVTGANGATYKVNLSPDKGLEITKDNSSMFYIDSTTGNVVFAGNLSGATGTFSGALSAATGTFNGTLNGVDGTFSGSLSGASGIFKGTLDVGNGNFTVDSNGNLTANSGTFKGSCTWNGKTIDSDYLNLKGLTIKDNSGNVTFAIDQNGKVTLGSTGTISWNDVTGKPDDLVYEKDISGFESSIQNAINIANGASSDATSAYNRAQTAINTADGAANNASAAQNNVDKLANGEYNGTFISGKYIYSPNIVSDHFIVSPVSSSGTAGGITINGTFNGALRSMFEISYYDSIAAPITSISAYGNVRFNPFTTFTNDVKFGDNTSSKVNVDFSGATVTGLTVGSTAVFG